MVPSTRRKAMSIMPGSQSALSDSDWSKLQSTLTTPLPEEARLDVRRLSLPSERRVTFLAIYVVRCV
jgi:hypothetical protein